MTLPFFRVAVAKRPCDSVECNPCRRCYYRPYLLSITTLGVQYRLARHFRICPVASLKRTVKPTTRSGRRQRRDYAENLASNPKSHDREGLRTVRIIRISDSPAKNDQVTLRSPVVSFRSQRPHTSRGSKAPRLQNSTQREGPQITSAGRSIV